MNFLSIFTVLRRCRGWPRCGLCINLLAVLMAGGANDALAHGPHGGGPGPGGGLGGGSGLGSAQGRGLGLGLGSPNELHVRENLDNATKHNTVEDVPTVPDQRIKATRALLRQHRDVLEADPLGAPVRRRQILVWSPTPGALAAAQQLGFIVLQKRALAALGETLVTLGVPEQIDTDAALTQLRAVDPQGDYDFNHLYFGSGDISQGGLQTLRQPVSAPGNATGNAERRIGLIDSGVAIRHPALQGGTVTQWGCDDKPIPSAHGTAVASLLTGRDGKFRSGASGTRLFAADVYCGLATGGAVDQIAEALAWLAKEQVAVINLSLVGPPNRTLERVVGAMLRRGHLLIAAVGNDGPNAPPLYPASYPGVVGVSAIDPQRRPLPEAARGPQVMFAAPGSQLLAAASDGAAYRVVRGTSFAAPFVAALLAQKLARPEPQAAQRALTALIEQAAGADHRRTPETGWGVVGEEFRVAPGTMPAAPD